MITLAIIGIIISAFGDALMFPLSFIFSLVESFFALIATIIF